MENASKQSCAWTDKKVPVHLIGGFLGAGKTTWIQEQFQCGIWGKDEKVLYLLCESSEEEPVFPASSHIILQEIEYLEDFCRRDLTELTKEHQPDRIIVEANGMWQQSHIRLSFPSSWNLEEMTVLIDASSFELYVRNMGSLMMEKLRFATRILFNRCTEETAKALRKRNLRLINQTPDIRLSFGDGRTEPYDNGEAEAFGKGLDSLILSLEEFGYWIVDFQRQPEAYEGKSVEFEAYFSGLEADYCQLGRSAMVCCAQDMVFFSVYAVCEELRKLSPPAWVRIMGTVKKSASPLPNGAYYYLAAETAVPKEAPSDSVIYF